MMGPAAFSLSKGVGKGTGGSARRSESESECVSENARSSGFMAGLAWGRY
jgi:hypothetical protein